LISIFKNAKTSGRYCFHYPWCQELYQNIKFDVVKLSSGFLSFHPDDWLRLVERVHSYGLKAKPELGIQVGAGGDTEASALEEAGTSDPSKIVNLGKLSMLELSA
jgi:phosphosulfolactate synthase (CoM biosynthesis protein A)